MKHHDAVDKVPKKLEKDTIIEALFEIRFSSDMPNLSKILPGILFNSFNDKFSKIEGLPASNIPDEIANKDPSFRYVPFHRLVGEDFSMQVGNFVFSLACKKPYAGWCEFYSEIVSTMDVLKKTNLINNVERFSIKYINVIPKLAFKGLEALNVSCQINGVDIDGGSTRLRTETKIEGFLGILEIASPITATTDAGDAVKGVLVDVDLITTHSISNFWDEYPSTLNKMHDLEKRIFFGVLKPETLDLLGPSYE